MKRSRLRQRNPKRASADRKFSASIMHRDNQTCRKCGHPAVHAHHVVQRSERPDLVHVEGVAVAVCARCHHDIHEANERPWIIPGWAADEWLDQGGELMLPVRFAD